MRLGPRRPDRLDGLERRLVWLLGSPRSGTTWFLNLLARRPGVAKIDEPGIGTHLGAFFHEVLSSPARLFPPDKTLVSQGRASSPDYFFADAYADVWRPDLRRMVLRRFQAQLERAGDPDALCVVKEPNGAQAVEMLLDACPQSRVLWLLRDGRDVVDSKVDAIRSGAWGQLEPWEMTQAERLRYVEDRSWRWLRRTEMLQRVHDRLPEHQRLLVRYESALTHTAAELHRTRRWLGLPSSVEECEEDAAALQFANIPAEHRGRGRFARSATPGAWRQNLTPDEQAVMERVMGAKLAELGYG